MNFATRLFSLAVCMTAAGCGTPAYEAQGNPQAKVQLSHKAEICVGTFARSLHAERDGYAVIPAGERLFLLSKYTDYRAECGRWVSFVPQAAARYQIYTQVTAERCVSTVMREDSSTATGLRLETSAVVEDKIESPPPCVKR